MLYINKSALFGLCILSGASYSNPLPITIIPSTYCNSTKITGAGTGSPLPGSSMVAVIDEEFNGNSLNSNLWRVEESSTTDGINAVSAYTNRPDNVQEKNGKLILQVRKEFYIQPMGVKGAGPSAQTPADLGVGGVPTQRTLMPYTAGRVDTATKFNIDLCNPGRIDIVMNHPETRGMRSSAWIFNTDPLFHGPWPAGGEIDIAEIFNHGTSVGEDFLVFARFFGGQWPFVADDSYFGPPSALISEPIYNTHTYSLAWDSKGMSFIIDDVVRMLVNENGIFDYNPATEQLVLRTDSGSLPLTNSVTPSGDFSWMYPWAIDDAAFDYWNNTDNSLYSGSFVDNSFPNWSADPSNYMTSITRIKHPAPFDHNGFYLILQANAAGFFGNNASQDYVNIDVSAVPHDGVVTEAELNSYGIYPPAVPRPGEFPSGSAKLEIDSVKYYILNDKTQVCHKYDSKNRNTLQVEARAVKAHLDHGDYLGDCRQQYVIGPRP